jgi:ketosteroid isomerase-like protein
MPAFSGVFLIWQATLACGSRTILGAAHSAGVCTGDGFMTAAGERRPSVVSAIADGYAGVTAPDGTPLAVRHALARAPWAEATLRALGVRLSLGPKREYIDAAVDFGLPRGTPINADARVASADGVFNRSHVMVFGHDLPHGRWAAPPETADLLTHEVSHVCFDFLSRAAKDAVLDTMREDGKWLARQIHGMAGRPGSAARIVSAGFGLDGWASGTGGKSLEERIRRRRLSKKAATGIAIPLDPDPRKDPILSSPPFMVAWHQVGATLKGAADASRDGVWHTPEEEPHYWLLAVRLAQMDAAGTPQPRQGIADRDREEFRTHRAFENECIAHFAAASLAVASAGMGEGRLRRDMALRTFAHAAENAAGLASAAPAALRGVSRQVDVETSRSGTGHAAALFLLAHRLRQRGLPPQLTEPIAMACAFRDGITVERAAYTEALAASGGDPGVTTGAGARARSSEWTLASAQMTRLLACGTGPVPMPLSEVREACEALVRRPHVCMALDIARLRAQHDNSVPDLFVDTLLAGWSFQFCKERSSGPKAAAASFAKKSLTPDDIAKYRDEVAGILNGVRELHMPPGTDAAADAIAQLAEKDWGAMGASDPRAGADGLLAAVEKLHADVATHQTPLAEALLYASLQMIAGFADEAIGRGSWEDIGGESAHGLQDAYRWARTCLNDSGFGWAADHAHQGALVAGVTDVIRTTADGRFLADENAIISSGPADRFMLRLDTAMRHLDAMDNVTAPILSAK